MSAEPSPSVPSDLRECFSISRTSLEASRNCDAIATLSRFLNSATLRGGLLGRMGTTHAALKGGSCKAMLNVRSRNVCDAGGARRHHAGPRLRAPHPGVFGVRCHRAPPGVHP